MSSESTQTWKQQHQAPNSAPAPSLPPSPCYYGLICPKPHKYTWKSLLNSDHPLDHLLKIEINILVIAILIILIFYLGLKRRCSRSSFLNFLLFMLYAGFTTLISYTMGMMYSSTLYHALYGLWAGFVLNAYLNIDTIVAYSLMDHENRRRYFLELFLFGFWFWWIMSTHLKPLQFYLPTVVLWMLMFYTASGRMQVFELACQSGLAKFAKSTHEFMKKDSENQQGSEMDPKTMKGYKYLLEDPDDEDFVTLERLWQFDGGILISTNEIHYAKLKDICVSFALFKLLLQRFAGYTMQEANQDKSWEFVRRGLLDTGSARSFKVIEDELHYVYDFFYTKYCLLGIKSSFGKMIRTGLYIGCCIYISIELALRPLEETKSWIIYKGDHVIDVGITRIALVLITLLEVAQLIMLVLSNWTIVRWLVMYVKSPQSLTKLKEIVLLKLFPLTHKWNFVYKPWARKLSQYSFLEGYDGTPRLLRLKKIVYIGYPFIYIPLSRIMIVPRIGQVEDSDIDLSDEVKIAVIECLKTYNDEHGPPKLTNGITSLTRNGVSESLSWACHSDTQVEVVMAWHIATSIILKRQSPSGRASANLLSDFRVATNLSKYCAYLVVFVPELLPGHPYTAECIFDNLVKNAKNLFGKKNISMESKIQKLLEIKEEDTAGCSLKRGGLIAQTVLNEVQNQARIWKILAEFWAEMILFLAPSNNATAHAERLAKGGEFITHLWALLTHAGILTTTDE